MRAPTSLMIRPDGSSVSFPMGPPRMAMSMPGDGMKDFAAIATFG